MKDIRHITSEELEIFLKENGEKSFRAKQIEEWLWKKHIRSFDEMSDISLKLRNRLKEQFEFKSTNILGALRSKDKTTKFVFKLHDSHKVEGVLIPSNNRVTACISSQVGCPMKCTFCATGQMGFTRNLHFSEIIDQFALMDEKSQEYIMMSIGRLFSFIFACISRKDTETPFLSPKVSVNQSIRCGCSNFPSRFENSFRKGRE